MQTAPMLTQILAISLLLGVIILILVMREERRLRKLVESEREKNLLFTLMFHQLDDLLTSIKWHSEMMMTQEFGKLSISQLQIMNKVNMSVGDASRLLQKFVMTRGKIQELSHTDISVKDHLDGMIEQAQED